MNRNKKLFRLVIGTSLMGTGLFAGSAHAIPNQSDITGTNIWNSTSPIFRGDGKLDAEIIEQARQLDQELTEASQLCCYTTISAPMGPRRFARRPSERVCSTPTCERLDDVVRESRAFLAEVNETRLEQKTASRNRAW